MDVAFPYRFDETGRTATVGRDRHILDMIEQVLFTNPGERVNNPEFGCGILQLIFAPNSEELAAATQYLVQSALQQWLGDVIKVDDVAVLADDANLRITVVYTVLETEQSNTATFARQGPAQ
jgi:hypothetical protein